MKTGSCGAQTPGVGPADALQIGDLLDHPVYTRPRGGAGPLLLLAAGQRIESELQLSQLRAEGFAVLFPGEVASLDRRCTLEPDAALARASGLF